MFRLVTSQLIESGGCCQVDIINTFGVSKSSVIRFQNLLRKSGPSGLFKPRVVRTGGTVFTQEVLSEAQSLLAEHFTRSEVSEKLNIKYDTLRKAINDGHLKETRQDSLVATTKSFRNTEDVKASEGMGTACTRIALF